MFILTLVLFISDTRGVAFTSVTQEYGSQAACENAKKELRNNLRGPASVVLLTCTSKS